MFDDKSSTTVNSVALSAGKLFFFLCFLPYIITYCHIRHNINSHWEEIIMVDVVNTASINAVASGMYGRKLSQASNSDITYYKMLKIGRTSNVFGIYQPDVFDAAESAIRRGAHEFPYLSVIPTLDRGNSSEPCIFISKASKICGLDVIHTWPISTQRSSATSTRDQHWIHHIMFQIPATSFWILLNCLLAFWYWNQRVPPDTVAKIYSRIIPMGVPPTIEVWRILTGSTAHFEPLHLGMNMLSLSALGKELEGRQVFTSMSFFMYNLSLITIVSTIWLGLQRFIQIYFPNHFNANGATVGYSGVLFAWMVVASLGQTSTCPIIFAPSICFPTYELFGPFKFSLSPIVQLAVMQVILPRVSFTGHLAGIIAGFLVHWEWLPIRYSQPALIIPILYLAYLIKIRKAVTTFAESGERLQGPIPRVRTILGYQVIVLIYSVTVMGPISATTLSFAVNIVFWYQFYRAVNQSDDPNNNVATWSRAYIFSTVLVVITDAMTIGGWAAFSSWKTMPIVVVIARTVLLFVSMIVALTAIPKIDDGIFEWTLNYTTLHPCRELGHFYPWLRGTTGTPDHSALSGTVLPERSGGAFEGVGHRLGGSNSHKTNPWKVHRDIENKSQTN